MDEIVFWVFHKKILHLSIQVLVKYVVLRVRNERCSAGDSSKTRLNLKTTAAMIL